MGLLSKSKEIHDTNMLTLIDTVYSNNEIPTSTRQS
jgi:hypothetical protein